MVCTNTSYFTARGFNMSEVIRVGNVLRTYREGGVVTREEAEDGESLEIQMWPEGARVAKVRASASMTINLGNYESVRVSTDVELPCVVEELEDCYKTAREFVDTKLNKEVADIRAYKRKEG